MKRWFLALAPLFFGLGLAACGGSSSETPFPLEPDLGRMGDAGPSGRYVVFTGQKRDGGADSGENEDEAENPEPE